jgi:hypothetical protein
MPAPALLPRRSGCSRPGCRFSPAVVYRLPGGVSVTYCTNHAEAKAALPGVEVAWLADGYAVCPLVVCARVIPERLLQGHYNLAGLPCPPPGVTLAAGIMAG